MCDIWGKILWHSFELATTKNLRDKFKKKFSLDSLNTRQTKTMDVESSQKSSEIQNTEIPLLGRSESHVALDSLRPAQLWFRCRANVVRNSVFTEALLAHTP